MLIQKIVHARTEAINFQIQNCLVQERNVEILSQDQLRVSTISLQKISLSRISALIYKVVNFVVKIFNKKFLLIDSLIESNRIASQLIENYTQLIKDPNAQIDDAGFVYDVSLERLKKSLPFDPKGPIRVTMVGIEYAGLFKQGGLGEAIEGLSRGLVELDPNNEIQLIFPKYSHLPKEIMERLGTPETHIGSQGEVYQVYTMKIGGVLCQFIEDPSFVLDSERPDIYGPDFPSQMNRFATFSSLAADLIQEQKKADVIHLHDWHVAGVALKMKNKGNQDAVPPIAFTFHNNQRAAQGRLSMGAYSYDPIVKGYQEKGILKENENLLVRTLKEADAVSTVSHQFAVESQQPAFGEGVSFAVRSAARVGKLVGIMNGANLKRWDPATDKTLLNWKDPESHEKIDLSYSADSPDLFMKKQMIRSQLQKWKELFVPEAKIDFSKPLVTYIGRFDWRQKGIDRLEEAIVATLKQGGQFICMGSDEDLPSKGELDRLQAKYREGVLFLRDYRTKEGLLHFQQGEGDQPGIGSLIRGATDFIYMPSKFEPCGLVQFEGWQFGALAIGAKTGGLADSINDDNGFLFTEKPGECVEKALQFWKGLTPSAREERVRNVMRDVKGFGWKGTAVQYRALYAEAMRRKAGRPISTLEGLKFRRLVERKKVDPILSQEEDYLIQFYHRDLSSEELGKIYMKIPRSHRDGLPSPYGRKVNDHKYDRLGSFLDEKRFAVSAPAAKKVELVLVDGEVVKIIPMNKDSEGVWEGFVPDLKEGQKYQYRVDGAIKIDPYARQHTSETRKKQTPYSVVTSSKYAWEDQSWVKNRIVNAGQSIPMSIYEVHPMTMKKKDGVPLNYRELAHLLVEQCRERGSTHVELMGILEHPREKSWGYQVTGYFAPTSRMGTVDDFKYLVNHLHQNQIGVILDWVPAHFDISPYGLSQFDGSNQYEATGLKHFFSIRNLFFKYGAKHFDFSRKEVREFLISSAMYWIREMHIDGLRVDCVRSMLSSEDPDSAHLFLRDLNAVIHKNGEGAITIAEEFSGDRRITGSASNEGFDFDMKWHAGFLHHLISYFSLPLSSRQNHYKSIEEAVHCDDFHKQVMFIGHDQAKAYAEMNHKIEDASLRTAQARAISSLLICLPGKKLQFMSTEGIVSSDWEGYVRRSDGGWFDEEKTDPKFLAMMARLNEIYKNEKAFYEFDANGNDLKWIPDENQLIHAYRRKSSNGDSFICLHNFTDQESKVELKNCQAVFSSDAIEFGGQGKCKQIGNEFVIPPLTTLIVKELPWPQS